MAASHLIISHANCIDGFTAAWAARRHLLQNLRVPPDDIDVVFAHYGDKAPDAVGRNVIIVDFSYPRATLEVMNEHAASLLVLDHHKTAQADLAGLDFCRFDMKRSGAGLAWDELTDGDERPLLVSYVEDRDLWKFELTSSREVNAYIQVQEKTWDSWDELARVIERDWPEVVFAGKQIGKVTEDYVHRALAKHIQFRTFGEYRVPCVNSTFAISELCHELALKEKTPFAASWFEENGFRIYSLRGNDRDYPDFDVSVIAKRYGGGGHKGAAGFKERVYPE